MPIDTSKALQSPNPEYASRSDLVVRDTEFDSMMASRNVEVTSLRDLEKQRGTPIPALFNQFYKFISNPSTVSVDTFKRMVDTDDTVGSGVDFLTTCLVARLGRYTHPVAEVTEFVNKALEQVEGSFQNGCKELLSATWAGFAVSEMVWENSALGFIIKKMVGLPPTTLLFETERTGELTPDGILQYQRNYNPMATSGPIGGLYGFGPLSRNDPLARLGDLPFPLRTGNQFNYLSMRIPVAKCVHYAYDAQGKFQNPYGRSMLRRAYKWWVMKDSFLQMLSVALDRKGTPLTVVFADYNATMSDPSKVGQQNANPRERRDVGIRADEAARLAFANVHNDSTIILPGKKGQIYDIEQIESSSNAEEFIAAISMCDRGIMRALLVPSLIFTNGDGTGSFALGQEHAKTFDKILDGMLAGFKQTLRMQLIKPLLAYNFPRSVWEQQGLGDFSKRELTPDEISKEVDIWDKAVNFGAVDMSDLNDLNAIRDKIGLEPRKTPIVAPGGLTPGQEAGQQGAFGEDPEDVDGEDGGEPGEKKPPGVGGGKGEGGKPPPAPDAQPDDEADA